MKKSCRWMALAAAISLVWCLAGCGSGASGAPGNIGYAETESTVAPTVTLAADRLAQLQTRVEEWGALGEAMRETGEDLTGRLVTYLWPRADAAQRAAEYQQTWSATPGDTDPVVAHVFDHVAAVTVEATGTDAVVMVANKVVGSDGIALDGLDVVTWTYQEGQWYRTTSFWVPNPSAGTRQTLDKTVRSEGGLIWSPISLEEVKRLGAGGWAPRAEGVFLVVGFNVTNAGELIGVPASYTVKLFTAAGERLQLAAAFDKTYPQSASAKQEALDAGMDTQLWYCFDAPTGLDLTALQYEITPAQ